jgi:uncharacterized membrane protein YbhN (UPF0104 family)
VEEPLVGVWRSVALGYLAGLVLPAGGGELVKLRTLMKARGLDVMHSGSAVALDRLFDLFGLTVGLALLGGIQELPGPIGSLLRGMGLLLLLTGLVLMLLLFRGRAVVTRWSGFLSHSPWLAGRVGRLGGILEEADHLRGSRTWIKLLLLQVFITAFEAFTASIVLRSLHFSVPLPPWAGLQVLMFSSISFALPLLPGGVGSLQVACILALRPWGVPLPQALAYSLLAHLGHVLVVVGHGVSALMMGRDARGRGKAGLT